MEKNEIALALRDLDPAEAHTIVTGWLTEHDHAYTIWSREDVSDMLASKNLSESDVEKIVDAVVASSGWRSLGDCTDSQWYTLEAVIYDEAQGIGITLV